MAWNDTAGITDLLQLSQLINAETNQLFFSLLLGAFWVVCVIAMGYFAKEKSILAASTLTLFATILLWTFALVSGQVLMIAIALTLISFFLA